MSKNDRVMDIFRLHMLGIGLMQAKPGVAVEPTLK
jgi:hypothetical protein